MKVALKITLFCTVNTEHENFDGPADVDAILAKARETFEPMAAESDPLDPTQFDSIHVELVE